MKIKFYVPDMECESCSTLLKKRFDKVVGVETIKFSNEAVEICFDEKKVKEETLLQTIKTAGYRASVHPFEKKNFKERKREFLEKKEKFDLEWKIIKYSLTLFLIFALLEIAAYFLFLKNTPYFFEKYTWWFLYLNISVATLTTAVWHYASYKAKVTCMLGMMIGMTMGMQTGMMLGAVFGATNGLFLGAIIGVISGVGIGIYTGKCCGIMGILQGMMAGLMGGVMGPMVTLMLFADHILWFMPLYMLVNVLILWGFSYMIFEEMVENKDVQKIPVTFTKLLCISLAVFGILIMLMLYGIKSPLVAG